MKKILFTAVVALFTLTAFSAPAAAPGEVNPKVLKAFTADFIAARDVVWTSGADFYKAEFTYNERHVSAYYDTDGELLGVTRFLSSTDLPVTLQAGLKSKYGGYWITDLMEVSKKEGTAYYITIEDADTRIVLRAENGSSWQVHQKQKKA